MKNLWLNFVFLQGTWVLCPFLKMAKHNILGWKGEEAAADYLERKGHHILEKNWRFRGYEIDIISLSDEFIVFIEVKTRASTAWGDPEEAVGMQRMRRMVRAASHYLKKHRIDKPARFDIVAVLWDEKRFEMDHIEDAFLSFPE